MTKLVIKIFFISILFTNQFTFTQEISGEVKKILVNNFGQESEISFSKFNLDKSLRESIEKKS